MTAILISLAIIAVPFAIEIYFTVPRDSREEAYVADGK